VDVAYAQIHNDLHVACSFSAIMPRGGEGARRSFPNRRAREASKHEESRPLSQLEQLAREME